MLLYLGMALLTWCGSTARAGLLGRSFDWEDGLLDAVFWPAVLAYWPAKCLAAGIITLVKAPYYLGEEIQSRKFRAFLDQNMAEQERARVMRELDKEQAEVKRLLEGTASGTIDVPPAGHSEICRCSRCVRRKQDQYLTWM